MFLVLIDATASGQYERLNSLHQEMQELDQDEELIWQMVPLACSFILHFTVRQEGAQLLPQLLDARRQVNESGSLFVSIKVRQWLALAALEAGRLRLAYEESLATLDLIKQMAGYSLLKGYFELVLAQVLYQWNRLEEAHELLRMALHDAEAWQQLDLLGWGYADLMRVEIARGGWPMAQQALHEVEQLVQRERFETCPSCATHDESAMVAGARTAPGGVRLGSRCPLSRCAMGQCRLWRFPGRDTGVFRRASPGWRR